MTMLANAKKRRRRPDPLRVDPSRTSGQRRALVADIRRRFAALRRDIRELVVKEDAFGLVDVRNTRWKFQASDEQAEQFRRWLMGRMRAQGLLFESQKDQENAWWEAYIRDVYHRGRGRAFDDMLRGRKSKLTRERLGWYKGSSEEFLRSSFDQPSTAARVRALAARDFTDLKGFSDEMATKLTRAAVDGLIQGKHPRDLAKDIEKQLKVGEARARTIAQTETIRAHAEGQLDAMEDMGVEQVGASVEWSTADDNAVCPLCQPLQGVVLKLREARGMLPRHPNCRCAWTPAGVGEDDDQIDTRRSIEAALRRSVRAEVGRRGDPDDSAWGGADAEIDGDRPESIFNSAVEYERALNGN